MSLGLATDSKWFLMWICTEDFHVSAGNSVICLLMYEGCDAYPVKTEAVLSSALFIDINA